MCGVDEFPCDNGFCINAALVCNYVSECGDQSDERDCGTVPLTFVYLSFIILSN